MMNQWDARSLRAEVEQSKKKKRTHEQVVIHEYLKSRMDACLIQQGKDGAKGILAHHVHNAIYTTKHSQITSKKKRDKIGSATRDS